MILARRRAKKVAPDITAYRGQSGVGIVKTRARNWLELLRSAGVSPDAGIAGAGCVDTRAWTALVRYRAVEDEHLMAEAMRSWASMGLSAGEAVRMLLSRRSGRLTCAYSGPGAQSLGSALPDGRTGGVRGLPHGLPCQAVVVGVPAGPVDYDAALDASPGSDLDIEAMLLPSPPAARLLDALSSVTGVFEPHRETVLRGGAGGNTTSVREVSDLLELCDSMRDELIAHPQRARLVFKVSAGDEEVLDSILSVMLGGCRLSERNQYKAPFARRWACAGADCYPLMESGEALAYEMATDDAAYALVPPRESHAGFTVSLSSVGYDRRAFPGVGEPISRKIPCYELGTCENDGTTLRAPIAGVPSSFVTGVPGTGKTTLLLRMVASAAEVGVPFCVIEASSKREFARGLVAAIPNTEVLGVGAAAGNAPFRINPLWVAPGTQIDSHCQNVAAALLMAAAGDDQEAPIPQAMEALVREAYRRSGWDPSDVAHESANGYPTLCDLDVDSYVKRLGYEPRVKMNVAQALGVRIEHLMAHRDMLCAGGASHFWRVTCGRTVLELGSLGERTSALVATCVLRQILEWASCLPDLSAGELPRLMVVVDEINAILTYEGAGRPFSSLLERAFRELRAKGVTLVCAGQQAPSDDVGVGIMANAALRVAFRADWSRDAEAVAGALGLEPYQTRLLGSLESRHALVKLPGAASGVVPVATRPYGGEAATARHAACMSCRARMACGRCRASAEASLRGVDRASIDLLRGALCRPLFDPAAIAAAKMAVVGGVPEREVRHCLTGLCLEVAGVPFDLARMAFVGVRGRRR